MSYDIGFLMEQTAGHATNYRNLRTAIERQHPVDVRPWWEELHYYHPGGTIERIQARLPFLPSYFAGNTRLALDFYTSLRKHPYDAVLTNSWAAMLFPRHIRRTPTIIDLDSTPLLIDSMPSYGSPRDPAPVARIKFHLCRQAYLSARSIQAWSQWAKRSVVSDYGVPDEKVIVNPPGVDTEFLIPDPSRRDRRALRILFVGGDFIRKGGELLLAWYRQQPNPRIELVIATKDKVSTIPGVTVRHDITPNSEGLRSLLQEADIFVLPSLAECFGLATIEAMACGLPVIVSGVGGTRDIVDPGTNGFITKLGDPRDLSAGISALVSDPSRRELMGRNSRLIALKRFDSRKNASVTLTHLKRIAGTLPALPTALPRTQPRS